MWLFLTIGALNKDIKRTQVKPYPIITIQPGIYELPHELQNDLRLRILVNQEKSRKCLSLIEWLSSAHSSSRNESLAFSSKKPLKDSNQTFPLVHYFTWKLELVSNNLWMLVSGYIF